MSEGRHATSAHASHERTRSVPAQEVSGTRRSGLAAREALNCDYGRGDGVAVVLRPRWAEPRAWAVEHVVGINLGTGGRQAYDPLPARGGEKLQPALRAYRAVRGLLGRPRASSGTRRSCSAPATGP